MSLYTIDEIKELVKPVAQTHGLNKICLFGSYARGEATENSDIDLLLYGIDGYTFESYGSLYYDFEQKLKKAIDLVTAEDLNIKLRKQDNKITKRFVHQLKREMVTIYDKS